METQSIKLKISTPLIILMIIFTILSVSLLNIKYTKYTNFQSLKKEIVLSTKISELLHELQKERGFSIGYITSSGLQFKDDLLYQRELTDERSRALALYIKDLKIKKEINKKLDAALSHIKRLDSIRFNILNLSISDENAFLYYCELNQEFLRAIIKIAKYSDNVNITQNIIAYANFLNLKEYKGRERALGVRIINNGIMSLDDKLEFHSIIKKTELFREMFKDYASLESKKYYATLVDDSSVKEVSKIRNSILATAKGQAISIDINNWIFHITTSINKLKEFDDYLSKGIIKNIDKELLVAENDYSLFIIINIVSLIIFILMLYLIFILISNEQKLKNKVIESMHYSQQIQNAINQSSIVSKTDLRGFITYVNEEFCKTSKYSKDELLGQPHNIIRHPDNPKEIYKDMWNTIANKKVGWSGIIRNRTKDAQSYYVKSVIYPILDTDNNIVEYIALRNDVTDVMDSQYQLNDLLNNNNNILAVMIKIDGFKDIERFYGVHLVGKMQEKFEAILLEHIPSGYGFDTIYTLSDGKYVFANHKSNININLLIDKLKSFQEVIDSKRVNIENSDYDIKILIAISYQTEILKNLQYGIRELESKKKNFIVANSLAEIERDKAHKNMKTIALIKKAIDSNKIISYFQPIVNNRTKEIDKYESLVRLVDEYGETLSPFFFLEVSKKSTYYTKIQHMVLQNTFKALKVLDTNISINLSAIDIENRQTRDVIFRLLNEYKEYASKVIFELLEDESIKDLNNMKQFIEGVKRFNVKIAIDDFGAGYSNFERLLDYQPDILKIDGCLIRDIETNSYSLSVVKTIVAFAKEQGIETIAEFVENENIFNILTELGITYSQGYYFGKPEAISEILQRQQFNHQ